MELFYVLFGFGLFLAALAYGGWKVWQLGRRGWKDQLWVWSEANRKATLLLVVVGLQFASKWVWRGWSDELLVYIIIAAIIVPIPHIAYIIGRLLGMRDRAKNGIRLS